MNVQGTGSSDILSQPLLTQPESEVLHVFDSNYTNFDLHIVIIIVLSLPCLLKLSDSSGLVSCLICSWNCSCRLDVWMLRQTHMYIQCLKISALTWWTWALINRSSWLQRHSISSATWSLLRWMGIKGFLTHSSTVNIQQQRNKQWMCSSYPVRWSFNKIGITFEMWTVRTRFAKRIRQTHSCHCRSVIIPPVTQIYMINTAFICLFIH